ncbi:hypothetical protein Wxf_02271 [Wolbachia endosymbiont of Armadillidium vulgare]|nr:hypothetical protein Wxf_03135 [Armadillidium vulgare] [Wolbachia endosymbiont of Armadillidium vulgare]OJH30605.1 hypothetical protein Wxf_02931 [Armadillidium vulgare] [Wolbachia endosymbiont of Armadillidium vulgare]OJH32812.1 hypothetical protein Wxf_02271 [Wolbachia endosymbiont of Armadillidium vulgare]
MMGKPWVIEGYCNSGIFEAYAENVLIPILKPDNS